MGTKSRRRIQLPSYEAELFGTNPSRGNIFKQPCSTSFSPKQVSWINSSEDTDTDIDGYKFKTEQDQFFVIDPGHPLYHQ